MSVTAITWAWKQAAPRNLMLELLALADNANDLGVCWVRIATLAAKTNTTERTVQRNVTALMDLGLLDVIERRIEGSGNRCNLYLLPLPGVDASQQRAFIDELTTGTKPVKRKPAPRGEGDTSVTQGRVTPTTPRGDTSDTHNRKNDPTLKGSNVPTRAEGKPKPKGKHYLPDDWTVPDDLKAKLLADGYQADHIADQAEMFTTYWHERKDEGAKKGSWNMTFLNWMKRAGKEKAGPEGPANSHYKPNRGHYVRPQQPGASGAGLIGQLANRRHQKQGSQPADTDDWIDAEYSRT